MYLENADFFVRTVDMPPSIHGSVTPNDDGTFSVYINAKDSAERQRKALEHEVKKHIEGDDFSKEDVREIEDL